MPVNYIPTIGRGEEQYDLTLVLSAIRGGTVFPSEENVTIYAGWPQVKDYDGRTHTSDLGSRPIDFRRLACFRLRKET